MKHPPLLPRLTNLRAALRRAWRNLDAVSDPAERVRLGRRIALLQEAVNVAMGRFREAVREEAWHG